MRAALFFCVCLRVLTYSFPGRAVRVAVDSVEFLSECRGFLSRVRYLSGDVKKVDAQVRDPDAANFALSLLLAKCGDASIRRFRTVKSEYVYFVSCELARVTAALVDASSQAGSLEETPRLLVRKFHQVHSIMWNAKSSMVSNERDALLRRIGVAGGVLWNAAIVFRRISPEFAHMCKLKVTHPASPLVLCLLSDSLPCLRLATSMSCA